jgi:hypothetical protein
MQRMDRHRHHADHLSRSLRGLGSPVIFCVATILDRSESGMAHPPPQGSQRALSGLSSPDDPAATELARTAAGALADGTPVSAPGDRYARAPFAFVLFAAIELAFVFGLLVLTKLQPSQVLQITSGATAISVAGFFGRNAIVIIGRRMIMGPGNGDK